ncbi:uncharacterized protein [Triticum aestivum]|uniref:uncharacterized protein isoform X1 n=1 Tax=Triticum aestivum TaxID=4565 RepID=UPI001D01742B|nr:uncharacterized protein LOC123160280 isoform X1 [Triticum aestivum]
MGGTPRVCAARLLAAKCESQKCHLQRSRNRASNHGGCGSMLISEGPRSNYGWPPEAVALVQLIFSASLAGPLSSASLNSKVKATFLRFCAHAQARWFNTHFQMLMPEETRGKYWKNSCNQDEQGFCKREGV